jgi:hypothetical protein
MKKLINILLIAAAVTTVSCKDDYLDEKPYSAYTPITLKDALGFEASLVGIYNHYSTYYSWSSRQGWPSVSVVGTDVANATANQEGVEIPYYNYNLLTPQDGGAARIWDRNYIMVNNTNIIINSVEDPSLGGMTDAAKNKINAEAKFFRALAYNNLVTFFGDVPLVTNAITTPRTDFTRTPVAQIDEVIISDLVFAVQNLPDIEDVPTNSKGKLYARANKFMAMQQLAEVYLRVGKPELAEPQLKAIIDSGRFSLIKNRYGIKSSQPGDFYSDMFVYGNQRRSQGNTEAIWVMEQENPNTVVGGITDNPQQRRNWVAQYYDVQGMSLADSLGGRGLARLRISNWVAYGLFKDGDVRNSKHNLRRTFYYNNPARPDLFGKKVPYTGPDTLHKIAPHITKWNQFDPNDTFGYAMIKDFILMRLGETYLLLAEAQVKQGKNADAAATLNVLRQRAFPEYPAKGQVTASEVTLDFVLDERARELIGEEDRRKTLMRTKTLVTRTLRLNSNNPVNPVQGLKDMHMLLPIPQREIELNKDAVLTQNPGY